MKSTPKKGPTSVLRGSPKDGFHWFLKSYLYLLIFVNVYMFAMILGYYSVGKPFAEQLRPGALELQAALIVLNVYLILALLQMKKWAFWGLLIAGFVGIGMHLWSNLPLKSGMGYLTSVLIIYIFLQFGGKNKAWYRLK